MRRHRYKEYLDPVDIYIYLVFHLLKESPYYGEFLDMFLDYGG